MKLRYFKQPADLRRWLLKHHRAEQELWIAFWRKHSGKPSVTHPEALDQALAFGWIDGVGKRVDENSYAVRFTPRRRGSVWSNVNIANVARLKKAGVMHPSGLAVFTSRDPKKSGIYSFENRPKRLTPQCLKIFKANRASWTFFSAQPPGYRRLATWYVMSAKKDETRLRRLRRLISESQKNKRIV